MNIDIPTQSLSSAIAELGKETGLQVGVADMLTEGIVSREVRGRMTPQRALDVLLEGTGLSAQPVGIRAPVVSQNARKDNFDLGTIVLRGELQERTIEESPTSAVVETGEELKNTVNCAFLTCLTVRRMCKLWVAGQNSTFVVSVPTAQAARGA